MSTELDPVSRCDSGGVSRFASDFDAAILRADNGLDESTVPVYLDRWDPILRADSDVYRVHGFTSMAEEACRHHCAATS
jgi:hypothetical protein